MNSLPSETFTSIFSFLDTITCIRNKAVCKAWRNDAPRECGYFHVKTPTPASASASSASSLSLFTDNKNKHHREKAEFSLEVQIQVQEACARLKRDRKVPLKRTKGHLPDPNVLKGTSEMLTFLTRNHEHERSESKNAKTTARTSTVTCNTRNYWEMEVMQISVSQIAVAIRFEQMDKLCQISHITSLDFESMRMRSAHNCSKLTKKAIQFMDLSSLCQLRRISVRGCSNLITLRLPMSLEGIDASACTKLQTITFGADSSLDLNPTKEQGETGRGSNSLPRLKALNLNGARSLTSVKLFEDAMEKVTELDMTSVTKMSKTVIAQGLERAMYIQSVSLRYIATDAMIIALATCSAGCMESLRLVDIAFSHVRDKSVEKLVNSAIYLERCNLRGNKGISGSCYNQVPIYLSRRIGMGNKKMDDFSVQEGNVVNSTSERKRRKGDNIFFFTKDM